MNGRLYYDHPYLVHFVTQVAERLEWEGNPAVVLEETAFYPTGGGQPNDTGTLRALHEPAAVRVIDVVEREHDAAVVHVLDQPLGGGDVEGMIDWDRRFDLMQQHTGQHLLSAAFVACCGANTVGFHLAEDYATIDLDRAPLSAGELARAEKWTNEAIFANHPVIARFVSDEELPGLPLRKPVAHAGPVRIVQVPRLDCSACGGTHVRASGEIGIVKLTRTERRGNESRVEFLCGWRAVADYGTKNGLVLDLARSLSVGYWELAETVSRLEEELKETRRELRRAQESLLDAQADALWHQAACVGEVRVVQAHLPVARPDELKHLAQRLAARPHTAALLAAGQPGEKGHLVFARSAGEPALDGAHMGTLLGQVCQLVGGRGGGRPELAQGGSPDGARVGEALDRAVQSLLDSLRDRGL